MNHGGDKGTAGVPSASPPVIPAERGRQDTLAVSRKHPLITARRGRLRQQGCHVQQKQAPAHQTGAVLQMGKLREQGLELSTDPNAYLESYLGYKMEPNEDPDADWRLDTMVGSTCCVPLINGYLNADNDFMDDLHADVITAFIFSINST